MVRDWDPNPENILKANLLNQSSATRMDANQMVLQQHSLQQEENECRTTDSLYCWGLLMWSYCSTMDLAENIKGSNTTVH